MATVSEALGAHAAPHEVILCGKTYRFGLITQRVKSEFERFLAGTAMRAITDFKDILGPDGYAKSLDGIRRDIAAGIYSWNGPVFIEAMGTVAGVSQLLSSVSYDVVAKRPCTPDEIVEMTSIYETELKTLYQTILEESFPTQQKKKVIQETMDPVPEPEPARTVRRRTR